jgi:hypothetical protein
VGLQRRPLRCSCGSGRWPVPVAAHSRRDLGCAKRRSQIEHPRRWAALRSDTWRTRQNATTALERWRLAVRLRLTSVSLGRPGWCTSDTTTSTALLSRACGRFGGIGKALAVREVMDTGGQYPISWWQVRSGVRHKLPLPRWPSAPARCGQVDWSSVSEALTPRRCRSPVASTKPVVPSTRTPHRVLLGPSAVRPPRWPCAVGGLSDSRRAQTSGCTAPTRTAGRPILASRGWQASRRAG